MKIQRLCVGLACLSRVLLLATLSQQALAQGFIDLDFEDATIVQVPSSGFNTVDFASAFPGWVGCIAGVPQASAIYDNLLLDSSGIAIIDANDRFGGPIQGSYSLVLQAGYLLWQSPLQNADVSIAQTGVVPPGARSLLFDAELSGAAASFAVSLNGQALPIVAVSAGSGYAEYGADVSAFDGEVATLAFTVFPQQPHFGDNEMVLDAIQFSFQPIPEPSVAPLLALGCLLLFLRDAPSASSVSGALVSVTWDTDSYSAWNSKLFAMRSYRSDISAFCVVPKPRVNLSVPSAIK